MAYMLGRGTRSSFASLDRLSAEAASARGGATIAAEARRRMRGFPRQGERNQKKAA
jgi:hypothetical protein